MKGAHIKDVMETGYFNGWELQKLLIPKDILDESTYVISYFLQNLNLYKTYLEKEAPRLQNEHSSKFSGKFKSTRAVYQLLKQ
jgi:hypothetical protein